MVNKEGFEKAILPRPFQPVCIACLVVGGEQTKMVVSPDAFCAEKEMSRALWTKAKSGGKNTSRFGDWDCVLGTQPSLIDGNVGMLISLIRQRMMTCCGMSVSALDRHAALMTNELVLRFEKDGIIVP